MKNIIELNKEIEKIYNPDIIYLSEQQNFRFFKTWVSELDEVYFYNWEEKVKDLINGFTDFESPKKMNFLKVFHQDVLKKYNEIAQLNYRDLTTLKSSIKDYFHSNSYISKPKKESRDTFYSPYDNFDKYEFILTSLAEIYGIEDFEMYTDDISVDSYKDNLEDELLYKLDIDESNLEELFSYAHLSYCLDTTRHLLRNITEHIDYLIKLNNKIENYEEDKLTLDEVYDNDPNNLKLEFKINKMDVALFYRALHDMGIIFVDNKNQKHPYTNLKKYIDKSNIYYLENQKVDKVKNVNKEFAKFLNDEIYINHEIKLLDLISSKLNARTEKLLVKKKEGLL